MKNGGGSAFPTKANGVQEGMSLRDYFAIKALPMAWDIEQEAPTGPYSERMEPTYKGAAIRAYYFADAMLEARK